MKHITNYEEFQKLVIESVRPVVVDFYAVWCGPCQYMEPVFVEASDDFAGKVDFYKVNIDDARDLAIDHGIVSVPTLMFVKDGKVINKHVGAVSKSDLVEILNSILQ